MKRIIKFAAIVLLAAGITACEKENPIEWKLIGQGDLYSSDGLPEQYSVIRNNMEWLSLIAAMDAYNNTSSTFTETAIDFSKYSVIAVIDKVKGNGGWSIDITDITENSNNIVVTVENLRTGNAASVITQPFQIVKIPVSSKEIIFNKQLTRYPNEN